MEIWRQRCVVTGTSTRCKESSGTPRRRPGAAFPHAKILDLHVLNGVPARLHRRSESTVLLLLLVFKLDLVVGQRNLIMRHDIAVAAGGLEAGNQNLAQFDLIERLL